MDKKVEIFYGDVGTVRNELNSIMKDVKEIISLTQSVTANAYHSSAMLTVILIYRPFVETPEDVAYVPNERPENYL